MHLPLHELQPATPGEERKPAEQRGVQAITTGHPEIATVEHLAEGFSGYGFSRTASWCKRRDRPLRASVTPWWRARARVIRPRVILRMFHTRQWPRSPCRGRRDSRTN